MIDSILYGDCRETLKTVTNSSVQTCVTSPPYYGLRDYGGEKNQIGLEQTPEEYIDQLVQVFKEVHRVLKDDGTLWVNIGDSYYNYRSGKGQALPKQTVSKSNQDLPQVNPKRGNKLDGLKEKDLIGIPWMLAFALRKDGWYLRQDIIWHKPNPMPESVKNRCTKSHEYIFLFSKTKKYYFDHKGIMEDATKQEGLRAKRSVWTQSADSAPSAEHFATYPQGLIKPCVIAGSPKGGLVLDPFAGLGTTGIVAENLGRDSIMIELSKEYIREMKKRITKHT